MRLKQTTFYALWALRDIYLDKNKVLTSNLIAEKENISQGVLLRTLRMLSRKGILEAHQGRGNICGGFSLNKSIDDITLLEVIEATDGDLNIYQKAGFLAEDKDGPPQQALDMINQNIRNELVKYSIRDFFDLS